MASADWTETSNNLSTGIVDRAVTNGVARPPGGGNFVYGFNSLSVAAGAAALFTNQVGFAPMPKGGSVRGAVRRGLSGGPLGFSPFLFIGLGTADVNASAYMLGLSNEDPHHVVLVKGALVTGVPATLAESPTVDGVLARSSASYANDTWLHLRLDMVVNLNGDVLLQAFQNDLAAHDVASPSWVVIPGTSGVAGQSLANFVDDALAVNTGTQPFTSGRAGFGFACSDVTRRAYFDQLEISAQT